MLTRSPWALFDEAIVKATNPDAAAVVMALKALAELQNQHLSSIAQSMANLAQQATLMAGRRK